MQEIWALKFFEPDNSKLACKVLDIEDWAEEYNELSNHLVPKIPPELVTILRLPASPGAVSLTTTSGRSQSYRCPDLVPSYVDLPLFYTPVLGRQNGDLGR